MKKRVLAAHHILRSLILAGATCLVLSCATTDQNKIQLFSTSDPSKLNPDLTISRGDKSENYYDLTKNPGYLTLCAEEDTEQFGGEDSALSILHRTYGNFSAQVQLRFAPTGGHEFAGLGVRSSRAQNTWIRVGKAFSDFSGYNNSTYLVIDVNDNGRSFKIATIRYDKEVVHLQINKRGRLINISYSADGKRWQPLRSDFVFDIPGDDVVYLTAFSWGNAPTCAQFSNLIITPTS